MIDDATRLRYRADEDEDDASQEDGDQPRGAAAMVAATKTVSTYPTAANAYYALSPVSVLGAEAEGGSGSLTTYPAKTVYAYNLGSAVPPSGTTLLVFFCANRWVFRYDG